MDTFNSNYHFADLTTHRELINDIRELERKMKQAVGSDVTLIAFTQKTGSILSGDAIPS